MSFQIFFSSRFFIKFHKSALHTAVHTKNAEMVKLLLERDDIDVNIKAIFQYIINTVLKNSFFIQFQIKKI